MGIRVAVAEDQRMIRELLVALLARETGFELVAQAGTGQEAIRAVHGARPDVLVLDIGLPDLDGVDVARAVRAAHPQIRIIALSVHSNEQFVRRMLKAGAEGYVVKSAALDELVQAIRAVSQGRIYLSPAVVPHGSRNTSVQHLGRRERQVVALIAEGKHSGEIAVRLGISLATVEVHRRNIMQKLDLHTIAQLTKYAVREGLSPL